MPPKARKRRAPKGDGTCFRRKNGTKGTAWMCQIVDHTRPGGRRTFYGRTEGEVRKKRDDYKALPVTERVPKDKTRLDAFLDAWLDAKAADCAISTVHGYRWAVTQYINPSMGERKVSDLGALDVDELLGALRKKNCSTRTLRAVFVTLRAALNFAVQRRIIPISPMNGIKAPKHRSKQIAPLTREQARRFLDTAKDDRLYALYVLALACGLRQGELFGLKWCDVDLRSGTLKVRRQVVEQGGGAAMLADHTKSGRDRSVKLAVDAVTILREHQKRRFASGDIANELLFTAEKGGFLIKSNFLRAFYRLLERAECPRVRFHDLRHTAATLAFEQGQHPKQVQEMLGHASVTLTLDTYSASVPAMQDELADAMQRALFGT